MGDFNISDINWNLSYSHYFVYTNILMEIANSFDLSLSTPISQVPT